MGTTNTAHKQMGKWLRIAFFAMPFIALADTLLPSLFKNIINKQLGKIPLFKGHINSIGISFIHRHIIIRKINIDKINAETKQASIYSSIEQVTINFEWLMLFSKQLVIDFKAPNTCIYFNQNRLKQLQKIKADLDVPVIIKSVVIDKASFEYIHTGTKPITEVLVKNIKVEMLNIDAQPLKRATYMVKAKADMCDGKLDSALTIQLGNVNPTFDMDIKLTGVRLIKLNSFFMAYAQFDVNKGVFDLFVEANAKLGSFGGYIKPIITGLDVLGPEDRNASIGNKLWQGLIGFITTMFENQRHNTIASKIPFDGTFKDPKVNVTYAIIEVSINAFVESIRPSFDYNFDSLLNRKTG
jgi:hypothetical protein